MNKQLILKRIIISLFLILLFGMSNIYAANPLYLMIKNESDTPYARGLIRIALKDSPNGSYVLRKEGDVTNSTDTMTLSTDKSNWLYINTPLEAKEEKVFLVKEQTKFTENAIPISTDPGTRFHLINYEKVYIISCEDDNLVQILTNDEKVLEEKTINKGNTFLYPSANPQNILIQSKKPCYVYESSLADDPIVQRESGDSDTTTLFGNLIYFFNPGHIWISSYEKNTSVKLLDENQITLKQLTINPDRGVFVSDLPAGSYSLISSSNVTLQTGFLDNENYSIVIGEKTTIHGFSFGDLLFYSPFADTQIHLKFDSQNIDFTLPNKGDTKIISVVENFSPSMPEYGYFVASGTAPFYIISFSSGDNFGGEYVPGDHGSFFDSDFLIISSRITKEFSKDQKNLLEIYGESPYTSLVLRSNQEKDQEVSLNQYSIYDFSSADSMQKIIIEADNPLLCLQLHNYTSKGMFYYVPPIGNSITNSFTKTPTEGGGLFIANAIPPFLTLHTFLDPLRWKVFLSQVTRSQNLPFSIFFGGILFFLFLLLLILVFKKQPRKKSRKKSGSSSDKKTSEEFSTPFSRSLMDIETLPPLYQYDNQSNPVTDVAEISQEENLDFPSAESRSIGESSTRKIRIDPAFKPAWIDDKKEMTEDFSDDFIKPLDPKKLSEEVPDVTTITQKGMHIVTPEVERFDIASIPSLKVNEEEILQEIQRKKVKLDELFSTTKDREVIPDFAFNDSLLNDEPKSHEEMKNRLKACLETDDCSQDQSIEYQDKLVQEFYKPTNADKNFRLLSQNLRELYVESIVVDPGSANRLFIEGQLDHFASCYIASLSSKKLNPAILSSLTLVKLNANDSAKATTMTDSFNTFDEAGKAFAVCKKKHIKIYISSYRLPRIIQGVTIYSVQELLNSLGTE